RVDPPSSSFVEYDEGTLFRISVPASWKEMAGESSVTFAPEGAVGRYNGQGVFTHGVQAAVARNETHDLRTAVDELIDSLARENPNVHRRGDYRETSLSGVRALEATLENVPDATGRREVIQVTTAIMRAGHLFYLIAVAPEAEFAGYQRVFQRVAGSIRF